MSRAGIVPSLRVRRRVVPPVIENLAIAGAPVHDRSPHERGQLRIAHGRVRAERDEIVERCDARPELALDELEHHRHRHRPRAVGNDHEHAPPVDRQRGKAIARDGVQLFSAQIAFGDAVPDSHTWRIILKKGIPNFTVKVKLD